jgi:hypothetical protein
MIDVNRNLVDELLILLLCSLLFASELLMMIPYIRFLSLR